MNRFLIILLSCFLFTGNSCKQKANRQKFDAPLKSPGFTTDYEHLFSTAETEELNALLGKFKKETTNEIVIITIDSKMTPSVDFDAYNLSVARDWWAGKEKSDNGIIIGISTQLRKIRITNGYGIQKKLSDAETKKIIDEVMIPEFKQGKYFEGTKNGLKAIMQMLRSK